MVKQTQTIRRLFPTTWLSVFDHFVWLALKGLIKSYILIIYFKILHSIHHVKIFFRQLNIPCIYLKILLKTKLNKYNPEKLVKLLKRLLIQNTIHPK